MPRLKIWNGQLRIIPKHVAYSPDPKKVDAAMIRKYGPLTEVPHDHRRRAAQAHRRKKRR